MGGKQSLERSPATYFLGGKPLKFRWLFLHQRGFLVKFDLSPNVPLVVLPAEVSATLRLIQSYAIAQPQATHPKSSSQRTLECFFFERNSGSVFLNTWYCVIQKCLNEKNTLTCSSLYSDSAHIFQKRKVKKPPPFFWCNGYFFTGKKNTRMSTRKLGSMVRINGQWLVYTFLSGVFLGGEITHWSILTSVSGFLPQVRFSVVTEKLRGPQAGRATLMCTSGRQVGWYQNGGGSETAVVDTPLVVFFKVFPTFFGRLRFELYILVYNTFIGLFLWSSGVFG